MNIIVRKHDKVESNMMGRAQCLVARGNQILMVKHRENGMEYFCLPGGGVEAGEQPIDAEARELREACLAGGANLRLISRVMHDGYANYTFQAEIGGQAPSMGEAPEVKGSPLLMGLDWRPRGGLGERGRAHLRAEFFAEEVSSWGDDIRYPSK